LVFSLLLCSRLEKRVTLCSGFDHNWRSSHLPLRSPLVVLAALLLFAYGYERAPPIPLSRLMLLWILRPLSVYVRSFSVDFPVFSFPHNPMSCFFFSPSTIFLGPPSRNDRDSTRCPPFPLRCPLPSPCSVFLDVFFVVIRLTRPTLTPFFLWVTPHSNFFFSASQQDPARGRDFRLCLETFPPTSLEISPHR